MPSPPLFSGKSEQGKGRVRIIHGKKINQRKRFGGNVGRMNVDGGGKHGGPTNALLKGVSEWMSRIERGRGLPKHPNLSGNLTSLWHEPHFPLTLLHPPSWRRWGEGETKQTHRVLVGGSFLWFCGDAEYPP